MEINPNHSGGQYGLLTVCIATYNRRGLLAKTLESLRNQTFKQFQLIVCDDCSTDGTYDYLTSLRWPNLKVIRNERNLNLPGSMTRLFSLARSKYIGMQHDHDLYEPTFLEQMLEVMESHPCAGFGCCAYNLIGLGGDPILNFPLPEYDAFPDDGVLAGKDLISILARRVSTPIAAMSTIFRREIVERAGGYRPDWYIASDEDLYRRVAAISDVVFCGERLLWMRWRPEDRKTLFGSWNQIYTLHEFRADTTRNFLREPWWRKKLNLIRLRMVRGKSLWGEATSLWLHGEQAQLSKAFNLCDIAPLPTGNRFLNAGEAAALRLYIWLLSAMEPVGSWLGRQRNRRAQQAASGSHSTASAERRL